jgi:hypothetical protein
MSKRAAQRLANYLRSFGHRVKVQQHRSPAGAFYSVELLGPTIRAAMMKKAHIFNTENY